jgi:hypothetical protein
MVKLADFLSPRGIAVVEEAKEAVAPVKVATKHIPYIEGLWNALEESSKGLDAKRQYIKEVDALGLDVASIDELKKDVSASEKKIAAGRDGLLRIKKALAAGCEPTTPNKTWFGGYIDKVKTDSYGYAKKDNWPNNNYSYYGGNGALVFKAPIPLAALQRYASVKPLFDDVRVYSPRREDFEWVADPVPHDPVIYGAISYLGKPEYFEIARWDIDADLANVFGKTIKAEKPEKKAATVTTVTGPSDFGLSSDKLLTTMAFDTFKQQIYTSFDSAVLENVKPKKSRKKKAG